MTIFFINNEGGDELFSYETDAILDVGDDISINDEWYCVENRGFFCETSEDGEKRFYCNLYLKKL